MGTLKKVMEIKFTVPTNGSKETLKNYEALWNYFMRSKTNN